MAISAEGVTAGYGRGEAVLRGVDFAARSGEVTAVLGPNGAGKTTLLRVLLGVLRARWGRAVLGDRPVGSWGAVERARRLALVGQRPEVSAAFTAREVVALGRYAWGGAGSGGGVARGAAGGDAGAVVARAMERTGTAELSGRAFASLSVGQQQRVTLARAAAQLDGAPGGGVLLADEPMSAMDPLQASRAGGLLRELAAERGTAVVVVLHDFAAASRVADAAAVLTCDGRSAASGPAGEVLEPSVLERVYGVGFERVRVGGREVVLPV